MARIVVTGTGAICGAGKTPAEILEAVRAGRSAIAPIGQWDASSWPVRSAAEVADFNPNALLNDRKLFKLIRRTDAFGIYAAGQAIDAAGLTSYRDGLDPESAARFNDANRHLRRFRRRGLSEPVRLLSAARRRGREPAGLRARAGRDGEPDVAAAVAPEQRALPRRHPARAEGPERLHHQSQHQRRARDHRSGAGAPHRRVRARRRGGPRRVRSNRRRCSTTTASAC